ncbi:MAG: TetR/AcrR family transcriptional regulator [Nonomuraea sp.]|nr:TetR/AcrR family transcriptional regulator [Nonomuraea sp.]
MATTERSVGPRLRIQCEAVLLFAQQGYAATSIRDLARAVGLTNAGIYHHVASKEDLLAGLMRTGHEELIQSTDLALKDVADPVDRLALLITSLTAIHARNPLTTRVMDGELRSLTPGSAALSEIIGLRDAYEDRWRQTLADGVADGRFQVADQRLTRLALMSMCTGTSEWYRPDGDATLARVCAEFVEIGLAAVRCAARPAARLDFTVLPEYPWEPHDAPHDPRPGQTRS